MKDRQNHDTPHDSGESTDSKTAVPAEGVTRRSLAKAGVAAPILMSLVNQPAWGVERLVCGPSALASGNASTPDQEQSCPQLGCSPGFWKNNSEAWGITPYYPGERSHGQNWNTAFATPFSSADSNADNTRTGPFAFVPPGFTPSSGSLKLIDALLQSSVASNYYFHLVAGLLNASAGPSIYGATAADIIEIANSVEPSGAGFYKGVAITRSDVFDMLKNMQHAEGNECFLNAHGDCADGYVGYEGICYLVCPDGTDDDNNDGICEVTS